MEFISFQSDKIKTLSAEEREIVEKLTEVAKIVSSLYSAQKNPDYSGANFYPHDATREEIEAAAEKDPKILSPYTFVERREGRFVAVPYHVRFHTQLKEAARLLKEAAGRSSDKEFQKYLRQKAEDILKDNYDKSNVLWLNTGKSRIGFVLGPFDRYLDHFFFQKRAYMVWLGILDEEKTEEMDHLKELILATDRAYLPGAKRARINNVKVRVEDSLVFSGLVADFLFVGNNLPSSADIALIKKYGTMFTLFKPTLEWRFENWVFPIFEQVFTEDIQRRFSKEEIKEAFLQESVLHEACHALMRYEDAATRLQNYFPYFDELYTNLLGIKGCGTLILKNALSEKELEAILLETVCHSLYFYHSLKERPHVSPYAAGVGLMLEFLQKGGALERQKNGFTFDSYRGFMAMNQLTSVIEYYVALANHREAEEFWKKFNLEEIFRPFTPYLKGIPRDVYKMRESEGH